MMLCKVIFMLLVATLGIQQAMAQDIAEQVRTAFSSGTDQGNITFILAAFIACLIAALAAYYCCCSCNSNDTVIEISNPFLGALLRSSLTDSMVVQGTQKVTKSEFTLRFQKFKEDERTGSRHQLTLLEKIKSFFCSMLDQVKGKSTLRDDLTDKHLIERKKVSVLESAPSRSKNGGTAKKVPGDAESEPAQDASRPDSKPSIAQLLVPAVSPENVQDAKEAPLYGPDQKVTEMTDVKTRRPSASSSKFSENAEKEKQMPDDNMIWSFESGSKDQNMALHRNGQNDQEMPIPKPRWQSGISAQSSDKNPWHGNGTKDKSWRSSASHKAYLWPPQPNQYRCVKEIIITAIITISVTAALTIGSIALYKQWSS